MWEQGTLRGWPCNTSIREGHGQAKIKVFDLQTKKNNPCLGHDYLDYQQMMLKQEYQLIREANFPHSWLLVEDSG